MNHWVPPNRRKCKRHGQGETFKQYRIRPSISHRGSALSSGLTTAYDEHVSATSFPFLAFLSTPRCSELQQGSGGSPYLQSSGSSDSPPRISQSWEVPLTPVRWNYGLLRVLPSSLVRFLARGQLIIYALLLTCSDRGSASMLSREFVNLPLDRRFQAQASPPPSESGPPRISQWERETYSAPILLVSNADI